jgi:hypothetical protein
MDRRGLLAVAFTAVLAGTQAIAQTDSAARPGHLCWARVGPASRCRALIVTEIGVEHPMYTTHVKIQNARGWTGDYYGTRVMFGGGVMFNSGPEHALGLVADWDGESGHGGPDRGEARFRMWRGPLAYDLSLGGGRYARGVEDPARGLNAGVGVESARFAADLRVDWMYSNGQIRRGVFAGGHVTSFNAPLAVLIGAVVVAVMPRDQVSY